MKILIAASSLLLAGQLIAQQKPGALREKSIRLSTGVKLRYVEQGHRNGTPVIFLHGITDSWHSFETTLPFLPPSIRAFAISQRGHGDSDRPLEGYHPKDFAADIAAFIRQKNLGKTIVVGHSMGGVHAQQFALDYPQLSAGIVIVDSDANWGSNPGFPEFLKEVRGLQGQISREYMDGFQRSTLAVPIDPSYYELIVNEGLKVPLRVFQTALAEMSSVNYTDELKNIKVPMLLFWGDKDMFCSADDQQVFLERVKNVRLIKYAGTGHALHWEHPQRFAADLTMFVNQVKGGN